MELPLVSVIVPVFNAEKYIEKSILSILNQGYQNLELIIINDGSNDNSERIIKKIINKEPRAKYYIQKNSGPSTTRNLGIDVAKGEYLVFIDSDDTVEREYIQNLVSIALKCNFDIVSCGYTDYSIHGKIVLNDFWDGNTSLLKERYIKSIFQGVGGTLWGKIFKRDIIIQNNIKLEPQIFMCEDLLFVLEYTMYCKSFGVIQESLYNYNRLNEKSISTNVKMEYFNNLIFVLIRIENILKSNNYDKEFIKNILSVRAQSLMIDYILSLHNVTSNFSKKELLKNLDKIILNDYLKKYQKNFYPQSLQDKLIISLIRKNKKKILICYSLFLFKIKRTKANIKSKFSRKEILMYRTLFEGGKFANY